jgi:hypothetical protein
VIQAAEEKLGRDGEVVSQAVLGQLSEALHREFDFGPKGKFVTEAYCIVVTRGGIYDADADDDAISITDRIPLSETTCLFEVPLSAFVDLLVANPIWLYGVPADTVCRLDSVMLDVFMDHRDVHNLSKLLHPTPWNTDRNALFVAWKQLAPQMTTHCPPIPYDSCHVRVAPAAVLCGATVDQLNKFQRWKRRERPSFHQHHASLCVGDYLKMMRLIQQVCPDVTLSDAQAIMEQVPGLRCVDELSDQVIVGLKTPTMRAELPSCTLWLELPKQLFWYLMWCKEPIPGLEGPESVSRIRFSDLVTSVIVEAAHVEYLQYDTIAIEKYQERCTVAGWLNAMGLDSDPEAWCWEPIPPAPPAWTHVAQISQETWSNFYWHARQQSDDMEEAMEVAIERLAALYTGPEAQAVTPELVRARRRQRRDAFLRHGGEQVFLPIAATP